MLIDEPLQATRHVLTLTQATLPLDQARHLLPPHRSGEPPHYATLLRWVKVGVRAADGTIVKLEAQRRGGRWFTSEAAVEAFIQKLNAEVAT